MNYTTSKDYEQLWNLVQEGKEIVCFLEGLSTYVTIARKNGEYSDVLSSGVPGVSSKTKTVFINQCENVYLEFLPPDEWISVTDKIPEIDQLVLAFSPIVVPGMQVFITRWKRWSAENNTHWKPLPKAPEVGA